MHPHLHSAPSLKGAPGSTKCCHFPDRALGTSSCPFGRSCARVNIAEPRTFGLFEVQILCELPRSRCWHLFLQSPRPLQDAAVCRESLRELIVPLELEMLPKISWGFVLLPLSSPWVRRCQGGSGKGHSSWTPAHPRRAPCWDWGRMWSKCCWGFLGFAHLLLHSRSSCVFSLG